jgi:hypothetical protein
MPLTQNFLDWQHDNTYSTGVNTGAAFPAIIGGEYSNPSPELIPETDVTKKYDDYCAGFSTNHLLSPKYGYDEGFDEFTSPMSDGSKIKDTAASHLTQGSLMYQLGVKLLSTLERLAPSSFQPSFRPASEIINEFEQIKQKHDDWFVWLHFMEPHHPYEPPTAQNRLQARQLSRSVIAGSETDSEKQEQVKTYYREEVASLDQELQQVWNRVNSNTRVIFCADHGELLGEEGKWGHVGRFRKELLHVPLGGCNTKQPDEFASLVDVPTILLNEEHNQGSFSREKSYITMDKSWAVTDGDDIATPDGVFKLEDMSRTRNKKLERAQSSWNKKTASLEKADTEDLEQLGYM